MLAKPEFLKMMNAFQSPALAIYDPAARQIVPQEDMSPEAVWEAAQQTPGASIMMSALGIDPMGGEHVAFLPIRCSMEQDKVSVRAYLRGMYGAEPYELKDGTMLYRAAWADKELAKNYMIFLKACFSTWLYDQGRDAYIDVSCGPADDHQRTPGILDSKSMYETAKAFSKAVKNRPAPAGWNGHDPANFDLIDFCTKNKITIIDKCEAGKMIRLHTAYGIIVQHKQYKGVALVPLTADAKIKTWEALALQHDPERQDIARKERMARESNQDRTEYRLPSAQKPASAWKKLKDIRKENKNRSKRFLQTDVRDLDTGWNGLRCGTVTILSGYSGKGKSTLVTQMALSMISHGSGVAIYSGELQEDDYLDWFYVQAAGPDHVVRVSTGYDVTDETADKITAWLDDPLDIYDHVNFGSNVNALLAHSKELMEKRKVDCFIYDNLMMMEEKEGDTELVRQKKMVQKMHDFSQQYQVAVILVAHPRKPSSYFLGQYDICGNSAITNLVDTIIYVYKIDEEFREAMRVYKKRDITDPKDELYGASGCYNLDKARYSNKAVNARMDRMRPLYFDPASCRLLSYPGQVLNFPWDRVSAAKVEEIRDYIGEPDGDEAPAGESYQPTAEDAAAMAEREKAQIRKEIDAAKEAREALAKKNEEKKRREAEKKEKEEAQRQESDMAQAVKVANIAIDLVNRSVNPAPDPAPAPGQTLVEETKRQPKKYELNIF